MTAVPAAAVPNKWLVLVVACAGMFSFSIDVSSFGLAIPTLATAFRAPPDTILWLGLGFTLVSTGIILTMGRLGDTLGRKQVYLSGLVLFTLGVAACAVANGFAALLVARMVQAVGGAMILSNAIAAATEAFPREERGKAVGFTSAAVSLGLMAGGPFGGVVLDTLDWRALFWTRLPLLAAVIAVTAVSFPRTKRRGDGLHIDVPGSALVFVFLSATVVALNRGPVWGWASPPLALTVLAVALSLAALVWVESRVAHPVLALGMFRNRIFSGAITSQVINFAAMSAYYFLTPFLLTRALGLSNGRAGLLLLVMPAWMMVGSPITGGLSDRFGSRPLAVVGMLFIAAGLYTGAGLGPGSGTIDIVWACPSSVSARPCSRVRITPPSWAPRRRNGSAPPRR
ncbi:MAG: MFS transporter [Dehalococcoidia bacterium]